MAKSDALAQLKDIHLPSPIQWWPLAPGWYGLMIALGVLIIWVMYLMHRRSVRLLPKKQALELIAQYQKQYDNDRNAQLASARVSELLRRVALVYFPRTTVASLHGEEWIDFLTRTGKHNDFSPIKSMLLDSPFKVSDALDLKPLFTRATIWIKQRKSSCLN